MIETDTIEAPAPVAPPPAKESPPMSDAPRPHMFDVGDPALVAEVRAHFDAMRAGARGRELRPVAVSVLFATVGLSALFSEVFAQDGVTDEDVDALISYLVTASDHERNGPRRIEDMVTLTCLVLDQCYGVPIPDLEGPGLDGPDDAEPGGDPDGATD